MEHEIQQLGVEQFPPLLAEINDPPEELYYQGSVPNWSEYKLLAVVGSRRFSQYGKQVCEKLIRELAGQPIIIVSGLALGIDSIAHNAALAAKLKTVSVPGSGLDKKVLHPRTNHRLASTIVENAGLVMSEYEPLMPAGIHTFPKRNRIMAGMCHATLLIEAAERSGTLITARLATEYNREVLVVPHDITRSTSKGVHQFLKLGATPVTESNDILKALGLYVEEEKSDKQQQKLQLDLSDNEKKVIDILSRDKLSRDELIEKLDQPVTETNILLSAMEIKGLIKEELGTLRLS
mgnify:CR=1 FL=1